MQREVEKSKSVRVETINKNQVPMELLTKLVATQKPISENMNVSNNSQIHITSTNDTADAISFFYSKKNENILDCIVEVKCISQHAHWIYSLTLVNAILKLWSPAQNLNKVAGSQINCWTEWKENISERFNDKMSFSDFIKFQGKRISHSDEPIVEYIFGKDTIIEKGSFKM